MAGSLGISRRQFLTVGAGAGLALGVYVPMRIRSNDDGPTEAGEFEPNVWVKIGSDDAVTVTVAEAEMGQGIMTAIAMVVADELDADWSNVRTEFALADRAKYGNQSTGGSTSLRQGYERFRKAGAAGRQMLKAAAAARWNVPVSDVHTSSGTVIHRATGRVLKYGVLVDEAATQSVPDDPPLKDRSEFTMMRQPLPRLDTPLKVTGEAQFGIDVQLPDMVIASVARSPSFGGSVRSFEATAARQVEGVLDVIQIPSGVAVIATNYWAAKRGRDALQVDWDLGPHADLDTAKISALFRQLGAQDGQEARNVGDANSVLQGASRVVQAEYEVPYLAHAPMEPLNCTAHITSDKCEVWVATQAPTASQRTAAEVSGLPPEQVVVHSTFLGGGFGRRSNTDFVEDAVHVAKSVGRPVKLIWSREDDIRGGSYRPATYNRLWAALDAEGWPIAWKHRVVGPSISASMGRDMTGRIDGSSVEGAANIPYEIPNIRVTYAMADLPVTLWWWRSVGSSQNAYITESFVDEVAAAGNKDPFEFRQRLLANEPRHKGVLELAAEKAGWGTALPSGRARGIAVHESFGSVVCQVAEVSVNSAGQIRVHRVVAAVDCGPMVNPNTIDAQMQSSIVYGLSAAFYGKIEIERGGAKQSNFHDYPVLRIDEMPTVETHIVDSNHAVGGIGEPGLPPIAPAVLNAVFTLTGKRVRSLPVDPSQLT